MPSITPNLRLSITNRETNKPFLNWRLGIDGPDDSNMIKLDKAWGDMKTMVDGAMAAVGHAYTAATVADMTDHDKSYVYVGSETGYTNGNWYYWNEDQSAWVSGGVYNATALQTDDTLTLEGEAADAKATGEMIVINGTSSNGTRINITTTNEDVVIPTMDDVDDLKTQIITYKYQLSAGTDLNTVLDNGIYGIGINIRDTLIHKPEQYTLGTANLIVQKGGGGGSGVVTTQIIINDSQGDGNIIFSRLINSVTGEVLSGYDWKIIGGSLETTTGQNEKHGMTQKAVTDAVSALSTSLNAAISSMSDSIITYKNQLAEGTDLNTLLNNGIYGIGINIRDTLVHKPEQYTLGTANLIVQRGGGGGNGLVATQFLITDSHGEGNIIYRRMLNMNTGVVLSGYDWTIIGGSLETTTGQSEKHGMTQKAVTDALTNISDKIRWLDKKLVTFGDSRTWYDGETYVSTTKSEWRGTTCIGYQEYIKKLCGLNVTNEGVSGETSAQICDRIRNYNFSQYDAVFLEGGVNDFIKSSQVTIGTIAPIGSAFDTTTVYGAWQSAVEYILNNYPAVKIFIDIPAIAWKGTPEEVFPYSVAKIKKEVAELYNIPCLDLYKEAGINTVNRDYYFVDDITLTNNWHLHFNDYGNKLLGEIISEFINMH